jgi:anti-sigma B factor antagonist
VPAEQLTMLRPTPDTAGRASIAHRPDGSIVLAGEFDAYVAGDLDAAIERLPPDGPARVDVAGVTFIDSSALRVLILHHDRLRASGGELKLVEPSLAVRRLLEVSRLEELLSTESPKRGQG